MKVGHLTSGDLEGMDAGELREHLAGYLEAQFDRDDEFGHSDYDPMHDSYVLGVADRIARLSDGAVSEEEVIGDGVTDAVHGQGRLL